VFDPVYVLLGVGLLAPCQATAVELEGSIAHVTHGMWWFGAYGAIGFARARPAGHPPPSNTARCFGEKADDKQFSGISYRRKSPGGPTSDYVIKGQRWSLGGEGGWRMFGFDVGYLQNSGLVVNESAGKENGERWVHGLRFRLGLALAHELFSGGSATYSRACCLPKGTPSETACECTRTPVGASLFLYYGSELYLTGSDSGELQVWNDGMVGVTLKMGVGL
jgi:hypothetical protein